MYEREPERMDPYRHPVRFFLTGLAAAAGFYGWIYFLFWLGRGL